MQTPPSTTSASSTLTCRCGEHLLVCTSYISSPASSHVSNSFQNLLLKSHQICIQRNFRITASQSPGCNTSDPGYVTAPLPQAAARRRRDIVTVNTATGLARRGAINFNTLAANMVISNGASTHIKPQQSPPRLFARRPSLTNTSTDYPQRIMQGKLRPASASHSASLLWPPRSRRVVTLTTTM